MYGKSPPACPCSLIYALNLIFSSNYSDIIVSVFCSVLSGEKLEFQGDDPVASILSSGSCDASQCTGCSHCREVSLFYLSLGCSFIIIHYKSLNHCFVFAESLISSDGISNKHVEK